MGRDAEVDRWFAAYENPMKAVVLRVREHVLAADPRIGECIKWAAPTFVYKGNLASFFPKSKQHASLMFHEGARIPGAHAVLQGDAEQGRTLKVATVADADAAKADIQRVVTAWCDWRDAGGSSSTGRAAGGAKTAAASKTGAASKKAASAKKAAPKKARPR